MMRSARRASSEAGSALVELSLALPVLVVLMVGTIDYARVFYTGIELTNAARAGAQYGAYNLALSGNTSGMQTTATSAVNITGITATASRLCQCATDAGVFSATSPSANNCTSPVDVSCPGTHRVVTVTVTTTKTFTTVMTYPGVPSSAPLSRTATLRVSE